MCVIWFRAMAQTGRASPSSLMGCASRISCSSDLPLSRTTGRSFNTCEWTSSSQNESEDEWKVCDWSDIEAHETQVLSDGRCSEPDIKWEVTAWSPSISSGSQTSYSSQFTSATPPLSVPSVVVMAPTRKQIPAAAVRRSPRKPKRN